MSLRKCKVFKGHHEIVLTKIREVFRSYTYSMLSDDLFRRLAQTSFVAVLPIDVETSLMTCVRGGFEVSFVL